MKNNIVMDNMIIGGGKESVKLKAANGTQLIDNTFDDPTKIRFDNSYETLISGNTGLDDVKLRVTYGSCFAEGTDGAYTPLC